MNYATYKKIVQETHVMINDISICHSIEILVSQTVKMLVFDQ